MIEIVSNSLGEIEMIDKITDRQIKKQIRKMRMRSIILLSLIFHLSLAIVYLFLHLNGAHDYQTKPPDMPLIENITWQERLNIPKRPLADLHSDQKQDLSRDPHQQIEDAKHIQPEVIELSSREVMHDVVNSPAPLDDNVPELMTDTKLRDAEASNLSHLVSRPGPTDGIGRVTGNVRAPGNGIGSTKVGTPWSHGHGDPGTPGIELPPGDSPPPIIQLPESPDGRNKVIYCLDISASMQAVGLNKLELAIQAIKDSIRSLGNNDTFNIVVFSSKVKTMNKEMLTANDVNVKRTMQFLDNFTPESIQHNRGTNILTALEASLMFHSSVIVLVTDGLPQTISGHNIETDTQTILNIVREKNRNRTDIYVVALEIDLKRSVGAQLLISLTREHNGTLKVLDTETLRMYSK